MLEIRNRKTLRSRINICKNDVKIGDRADSLNQTAAMHSVINESLTTRINVYPASGNHNTMDHTSTTVCPKKE